MFLFSCHLNLPKQFSRVDGDKLDLVGGERGKGKGREIIIVLKYSGSESSEVRQLVVKVASD